ncbi:MAG: NAD-dependent epimerase/dehydratase family protein [Planctomycetaceae bacterium]|jgi:UDP-glucose 4-epimerase|nr:NAD-dependent epimerase/dehydratase family protein [Planctomycetaceae bacterium]MBT6849206.1 NAD-dependent epimerase/dehydratase family protein [Planctomycetaceae bacterium]
MTKYLVTGGAGFIGSHIVDALVARGDQVVVLDDLSSGNLENLQRSASAIEFQQGSILDSELLDELLADIDIVFHQAAMVSVPRSLVEPALTHQINATGTLTVLEAARKSNVRRLIYAGSSSCYGNTIEKVQSELHVPAPISPYGAAKLAGEQYCHAFYRSFGLATVTLRYFNVFGPRQDPASPYSAVIPLFITAMLRGETPTIFGDGTQSRDFTYIDNIVHGNLLAADVEAVSGEPINMANGESTSLLDAVAVINKYLVSDDRRSTEAFKPIEPMFAAARRGDILHSRADIERAMSQLAYESQVDFSTGIAKTVEYYRNLPS